MHIYKIFIIVNNSAINWVLCGAITEEELPLTLTKRRRRRWGEHGSSDNNNNNKCLMDMLLLLLLGGGGRVCVCWKTPRTMQNFVVTQKTTTTHTQIWSALRRRRFSAYACFYICVCVCMSLPLQLQLQTLLQFVAGHEFNVVEWGGAKSLERPNSLECHCETVPHILIWIYFCLFLFINWYTN